MSSGFQVEVGLEPGTGSADEEYAMKYLMFLVSLVAVASLLGGCGEAAPAAVAKPKIGVVIDAGGESDKSFNEYTLKGAREAAQAASLDFAYVGSEVGGDFEQQIEKLIADGTDLVVTVGFRQG